MPYSRASAGEMVEALRARMERQRLGLEAEAATADEEGRGSAEGALPQGRAPSSLTANAASVSTQAQVTRMTVGQYLSMQKETRRSNVVDGLHLLETAAGDQSSRRWRGLQPSTTSLPSAV